MAAGLKQIWYGDDFTGASDTLATWSKAGLRALLFLGVPSTRHLEAAGPLDVLGIAGSARAMNPTAMRAELAPVGRFAASMHVPVLHYKCCSTFDSSPEIGSLGDAIDELRSRVSNTFVPIVGGQPSLGRFCVFGNLFASAGPAGEVFRIDRHPTMSRHPVTPMHEADLRRHLAAQGLTDIALVDLTTLDAAPHADVDTRLQTLLTAKPSAVLFDISRSEHLASIGRVIWRHALRQPLLALGASSVAEALIAFWRDSGELASTPPTTPIVAAQGPVFVLAGSQSPLTAQQTAHALADHEGAGARFHGIRIDVEQIVAHPRALEALAADCARGLDQGRSVLAFTDSARDDGPPKLAVAEACGRLLARVLALAPRVRRVGVAGGDTSSLAVQALGVWALGFAGSLSPGVTLTRARADSSSLDGLELMLKGGQMGSIDLFERLLTGVA